eukprot:5596602-Pyramimonas_sp.AAC.1
MTYRLNLVGSGPRDFPDLGPGGTLKVRGSAVAQMFAMRCGARAPVVCTSTAVYTGAVVHTGAVVYTSTVVYTGNVV